MSTLRNSFVRPREHLSWPCFATWSDSGWSLSNLPTHEYKVDWDVPLITIVVTDSEATTCTKFWPPSHFHVLARSSGHSINFSFLTHSYKIALISPHPFLSFDSAITRNPGKRPFCIPCPKWWVKIFFITELMSTGRRSRTRMLSFGFWSKFQIKDTSWNIVLPSSSFYFVPLDFFSRSWARFQVVLSQTQFFQLDIFGPFFISLT